MRTKLYYTGYTIGFDWGHAYATGTRSTRRDIRRKLARMFDHYGVWSEGIWMGFTDVTEQLAAAILAGRVPRTINPHTLSHVLERIG